MSEDVGQKRISQRRSINPKKTFVQSVGKVVRLTKHADIVFFHQNVFQLPDVIVKNRHVKLYKEVTSRSLPVVL